MGFLLNAALNVNGTYNGHESIASTILMMITANRYGVEIGPEDQ